MTQFNLRQFNLADDKDDNAWLDWTRKRIPLFRKYCYESVLNQTNKDFIWLIYFDKATPKEFKPLFDELNSHDFIKPMFADGDNGFLTQHLEDIASLSEDKDWIVCSRIDNDDSLHKDAIQAIQDQFNPKDNFLISLTSGYIFDSNSKKLSHYFYPMSPFISIIEKSDKKELMGIFNKSHSQWDELRLFLSRELFNRNKESKFVLNKPYWLQIVHGDNVSNSFLRGFPVISKKLRNKLWDYGIHQEYTPQSIWDVPKYYNYVHWKRYFKCSIVKFFKG